MHAEEDTCNILPASTSRIFTSPHTYSRFRFELQPAIGNEVPTATFQDAPLTKVCSFAFAMIGLIVITLFIINLGH